MKRQLVILTELIAPYRIPVFNELAKRNEIDLHVIFLSETDSSLRKWRVYSEEIQFAYEVLPFWRRRLAKYNVLVNQNVTKALGRASPDVILCGGYNYLASWQAMAWAKRNSVPFLLWCESTANDRRANHLLVEGLKGKFLQNCHGFVVPGTSSFNYLRQMGVPSEKLFIAPNAVDIGLFSRFADHARARGERLRCELGLPQRYFVYVGRLVKAKGVLDLITAYGELDADLRSRVGLVLVGDGPMRAELEATARAIFPGNVHFAGFVHRDELPSYYALAECLVLPTHSDTWGMVVNEAMACGIPIICSDVAGCAADLVRNNGLVVASRNIAQLSGAMGKIALNSDLRNRMGRDSRKMIEAYSPEACVDGIAKAGFALQEADV